MSRCVVCISLICGGASDAIEEEDSRCSVDCVRYSG